MTNNFSHLSASVLSGVHPPGFQNWNLGKRQMFAPSYLEYEIKYLYELLKLRGAVEKLNKFKKRIVNQVLSYHALKIIQW